MSEFELPLLQAEKNGRVRNWKGTVEEINGVWTIVTEYGAEGGKMQRSEVKVESGKNVGRANETSPFEQACSELKSKFDKKQHQGYSVATGSGLEKALESMAIDMDIDQAPVVQSVNSGIFATQTASPGSADTAMENNQENEQDTDDKISEGSADSAGANEIILPMLAKKFEMKHLKLPCYIQPKLDGVRAIYYPSIGKLISRTGHPISNTEVIERELQAANIQHVLDGELYAPGSGDFNSFVGLFRKKRALTDVELEVMATVKFFVFEVVNDHVFSDRLAIMQGLPRMGLTELVSTTEVTNVNDETIRAMHYAAVQEGFEGLIFRNMKGKYSRNKRSSDLLKYKVFFDEEFPIVDFTSGRGREEGAIIFVCETEKGKRFSVRPSGTIDSRKKDFINGKSFVGKQYTVKFFEKSEDAVPRFPVGLCVREYH
eukprot:Nk52_evm61s208 gene=Nk52_evmTU61s208